MKCIFLSASPSSKANTQHCIICERFVVLLPHWRTLQEQQQQFNQIYKDQDKEYLIEYKQRKMISFGNYFIQSYLTGIRYMDTESSHTIITEVWSNIRDTCMVIIMMPAYNSFSINNLSKVDLCVLFFQPRNENLILNTYFECHIVYLDRNYV